MSQPSRYARLATFAFTVSLVGLAANAVCFFLNRALDARQERVNPVSRKYGTDLTEHYPGMSADEVDEMLRVTWKLPGLYAPFTGRKVGPVASRFVNVAPEGYRLGRNQRPWPPDASRDTVVFVLGGSTAFGFGVPDGETIPSHLQELLAEAGVPRPAVYNLAVPAHNSTLERIQLQQLLAEGRVPAVAVLLDGYNDRAVSDEPLGTPMVEQILNSGAYQKPSSLLLRAALQMPLTRSLSRLLHATGLRKSQEEPATDLDPQAFAELVVGRYRTNQRMTAAVAASFGVRPLFVWQPVPDFAYPPEHFPFDDLANPEYGPKRRVYEEMAKLHAEGALGPDFHWCADLGRDATRSLYVDVAHYSGEMSRRIAACIAAALTPSVPLSRPAPSSLPGEGEAGGGPGTRTGDPSASLGVTAGCTSPPDPSPGGWSGRAGRGAGVRVSG
ncbi:MAG TPA: SGNH/GDSL hydrolase family protein [Thermoanaerobaculia bacterium]|nr:SGNH/GDSL hydrolase family protein [Thermoanaerobaculia bacterium]